MQLPVLLVFLLFTATSALGATTVPRGTDIVFVVDQSGSMMGARAAGGTANDRYGKRFQAIKALDMHLLNSAKNGYVNRLSVIEFGGRNARSQISKVQITLLRKEIPSIPRGQDPTPRLRDIQSTLSPIKQVNRGDTDIAEGLAWAHREVEWFRDHPPPFGPGAEAGSRQRIIVLITDGKPTAKDAEENVQRTEIDAWAQRLSKDDSFAQFMVFGFNDASRYWEDGWGAYWRRAATPDPEDGEGAAYLIRDDEDVVSKISHTLTEVIAPGVATEAGDDAFYTAPAYLKGLNFNIDFSKPYLPDSAIQVLDPDGARLLTTDRGEFSAAIRLPHPPPGKYQLRTAGAPYQVQPLPIYELAQLVAPVRSVKQHDDVKLVYDLEGRGPGARFIPQENLPQVQFEVEMTDPNGSVRQVSMQYDGSPGVVVSQMPVTFNVPGDYRLKLTGVTKANNGREDVVYQSEDTIRVDNATPVQGFFTAPSGEAPIQLWRGAAEVPVQLRFRNAHTGTEMPVADVLVPGAGLRVGWFAVGSDGNDDTPLVDLTAGENGLTATMPLDFGRTRWDLLGDDSAAIRLQLQPTIADPWKSGLYYTGISESGDFWIGPDLWVTESPWVLLIGAAVLLFLLIAAGLLWWFFGERWLIGRSDNRYKRDPKLIYSVPRSPELGKKVWPLKGVRVVAEPRLVQLEDGDTWSIEKFRIRRLRCPGNKVAVIVRYRPHGAKKGLVKHRLEATNDSATKRARHSIQGLPDGQTADFVLVINKS